MDEILRALSPLLQALAIAVVAYLARLAAKKLHLNLDEQDEQRLQELARQGVLWAEEQARKAYVANGGSAPSGAAKRKMAVEFVERSANRKRLKAHRKMTASDLEDIVEVQLAEQRPYVAAIPPSSPN